MISTNDWRESYFADGPITYDDVAEDLKFGIVYFAGRDSALRPLMNIRVARIPQQWIKERCTDRFIRLLIYSMEYFLRYIVIPGRVENLSVMIDLAGIGMTKVPFSAFNEVYQVMTHHYSGRVHKFYVCH